MKQAFNFSIIMLLTVVSMSVVSCSDSDKEPSGGSGKSELAGIWYIEQTTNEYYTTIPEAAEYYNRTDIQYGDGEYWEFTSSKMTVHDSNDLADDKPVNYTYNARKKELSIAGMITYTVKTLTSTRMVLYADSSDGNFGHKVTIEFSKE